jgi:hypothetical protein
MAQHKQKLISDKFKFVEDPPLNSKIFFVSSLFTGYKSPFYSSIQDAIDDCDGTNYYRIIVEKGTYLETITMKNRVHLQLEVGVIIAPSPGGSGIIYDSDCSDSTITGHGKVVTIINNTDTTKYTLKTYNGAVHNIELDLVQNDGDKTLPIHLYGECHLKVNTFAAPIQIQGSATGDIVCNSISKVKNSGNMLIKTINVTGQIEQDADKLVLKFHKSTVVEDIAFQVDGGELILDGGRLESYDDTLDAAITINDGLLRLHNCYIKNNNSAGNCIHIKLMATEYTCIIQNSVLIAGTGGAVSIRSDYSPQNVLIYGAVVSNKNRDLNTTLVGGVITVNTEIK